MDGKLVVNRKKKDIIVAELRKREYDPFPKNQDKKAKSDEEEIEGEDGEEGENAEDLDNEGGSRDYDYLLSVSEPYYTGETGCD